MVPLTAIAWHPTAGNQLIGINKNDSFVHLKVPISLNICWSPSGVISTTSGDKISIYEHRNEREPSLSNHTPDGASIFLPAQSGFTLDMTKATSSFEDISITMRERAKSTYSIEVNANLGHPALVNNRPLYELWSYLFRMKISLPAPSTFDLLERLTFYLFPSS